MEELITLPGFDPPPVLEGKLSRGQLITLKKKQMLAGGRNPGSGLPLAANGQTCRYCEEAIEERDIPEVVGTTKRWVHLDDSGYFSRGRILCQMLSRSRKARPR